MKPEDLPLDIKTAEIKGKSVRLGKAIREADMTESQHAEWKRTGKPPEGYVAVLQEPICYTAKPYKFDK